MLLNFQILLKTANVKGGVAFVIVTANHRTSIVIASIAKTNRTTNGVFICGWKIRNLENVEQFVINRLVIVVIEFASFIVNFGHLFNFIRATMKRQRQLIHTQWISKFNFDEDFLAVFYQTPIGFRCDNFRFTNAANVVENS